MTITNLLLFLQFFVISISVEIARDIPKDLQFATSTSAYQIEGAWNEDGKSESIWDRMVHNHPELISKGYTGDVSCDSYHKTKTDVAMLKNIGFQKYRFSLSWCRILPQGFDYVVNEKGIEYYDNLINELIANGITPIVTLYHWDLPQVLQDLGGWVNPLVADWFEEYARVVFTRFGDRVKLWITINEPKAICRMGYGTAYFAPLVESDGIGEYLCVRNILMAHARTYHLYHNHFQSKQNGRISITIESTWKEPGSDSLIDQEAADRALQFEFGIYAHAIYSKSGDFPRLVKEAIARRSIAEGFQKSRLPVLSQDEIDYIRGTYDFFGLNYYSAHYVINKHFPIGAPSSEKDSGIETYVDPDWPSGANEYFKSVPWGFRKVLNYIKDNYGDLEIHVIESGFPDFSQINDTLTIKHHNDHLNALLDAIEIDGINVKTYAVWSLLDNFEWRCGYDLWFGIYHVDFEDPDRKRTPKLSAHYFKNLINTRRLYAEPNV